jgi:hypothetical protein
MVELIASATESGIRLPRRFVAVGTARYDKIFYAYDLRDGRCH